MNAIGQMFENQGGRSKNLRAWKFCDLLEDAFPKTIFQLKDAPNDEAAARILTDLMDQAEQSQIGATAHEKEALLDWLEGLLAIPV